MSNTPIPVTGTDQIEAEAAYAGFEAQIAAGLALYLQGEDPSPCIGRPDTVAGALALGPLISCMEAARAAIVAAAADPPDDTDVLRIDGSRLAAAGGALTTRAAQMHAHREQLLTE